MDDTIIRNAAIAVTAAIVQNERLSRWGSEAEKDAAADAALDTINAVLRNVWTNGYNKGAKDVENATFEAIEHFRGGV